MVGPFLFVLGAEVACERLLAPWTIRRVGDGGKGRDGFVFPRVFEKLFPSHEKSND